VKPRVYIETSIPSFYFEVRPEPEMVARREWTREFWEVAARDYELLTSVAVLEELEAGEFPRKDQALDLIADLPLLPSSIEIDEVVETYIRHKVMPADPEGDARHLALASFHQCDFLLTWNCRHLANANKFGHIRRVNVMIGLGVPLLVTPLEILGVGQ
jgi:hypothetical protein